MTSTFLQALEAPSHPARTATEPGWLTTLRANAAARFHEIGLPTTRNEDWKFTSVAAIGQGTFAVPAETLPSAGVVAALPAYRFGVSGWCELVFINGRYVPELSDVPASQGLTVHSLRDAIQESPSVLETRLGKVTDFDMQAFTALNTACMSDGAVVHVAPGAVPQFPVHLLYLTDMEQGPVATHPRTLIVAGESSDITVIESYGSVSGSIHFTNAVTEVLVGDNARVEHIKIQRESERAFHVGTIEAVQGADSRFRSFSFAIGGVLARTNIYSIMNAPGSDCTMNGLYLLHGTQHIDHQTRIEHAQPNCTSREIYKGVLDGSSHGVFNGKVFVRPEAQKTDGKQTNKNLLLSDGAKVDTKPQLEIFADDVKCTHGATVGRLDEIGLFYLQSRGIGSAVARRLLTYGFAAEVLAEVTQEPIRQQLERLVFEMLETSVR
ncbi:MAG: Fe-S cluster assembly protein SufD [Gemmatimonadota bacterium]